MTDRSLAGVYRIRRRRPHAALLWLWSIRGPILWAQVSGAAIGCTTTLDPTIDPGPADAASTEAECVELDRAPSRYWICIGPLLAYEEAGAECSRRGASLASIESAEENAFLAATTEGLSTHTNLWIGATRDDNHVWSWPNGEVFWQGRSDGEAPSGAFANWKAGEPNDASTVVDEPERCAVLTLFDTQWNDRACSIQLSYFCEAELPAP